MIGIAALVAVLLLIVAGGIAWLLTADLKPWIEEFASKSIERRVSIGTLKIGWGNPISLELTDLKVANAPWSTVPDMISIDRLSALIDPWSITGGVVKFQKLYGVNPIIVLEREADGRRNWRLGSGKPSSPDQFALIPQFRTQFPTLLDFQFEGGFLSFRGLGSYRLHLDFHHASIQATGDDQPVSLAVDGAYNGTPVTLHATTDSFLVLRDASKPFGTDLSLAAPSATIGFKGTVMDPLNFEGVEGPISVDASKLGDFMKIFTADIGINPSASVAGAFKHDGDHWEIKGAHGKIATSAFDDELILDEGPRGKPDDLTAAMRFANLDLNPLLPGKSSAPSDFNTISLALDPNPGENIDASIDAKVLIYKKSRIADFSTHFKIVANSATLSRLKLAFAGGLIDAAGSAETATGGTHVVARGALAGADAAQLAHLVEALAGQLTGRVDGGFDLDMTGGTLGSALKVSRGHAVLGMVQGSVSRDLMEKLSTDLRNLFRNGEGSVQVVCLLGVVDMRNGVATLSPLRLRSGAGTLIGGGQVDVPGKHLDITIQSEAASTGFFALDIPIRISGSFAKPSIEPQIGGGHPVPVNGNPAQGLSPQLRAMAEANPCLR